MGRHADPGARRGLRRRKGPDGTLPPLPAPTPKPKDPFGYGNRGARAWCYLCGNEHAWGEACR